MQEENRTRETSAQEPHINESGNKADKSTAESFEQFFYENQEKIKGALLGLMEISPENNELLDKAKELEEKERLLDRRKLELDTMKLLAAKEIPESMMKFLIGSDMKDTLQNVLAFKEEFDIAIQEQVTRRLAGKTPASGNYSGASLQTKEAIKGIIRR